MTDRSYIRHNSKNYGLTAEGKKKIPAVQDILVFLGCLGKVSRQPSEKGDWTANASCI